MKYQCVVEREMKETIITQQDTSFKSQPSVFIYLGGKCKTKVSVRMYIQHQYVAGPVVSALANSFGCRIVSIIGSIIAGVAFAISQFSPNIDVLILTYGVMGGQLLATILLVNDNLYSPKIHNRQQTNRKLNQINNKHSSVTALENTIFSTINQSSTSNYCMY